MDDRTLDAEQEDRGRREAELKRRVEEKDTKLREMEHRAMNNLQLLLALIREGARGITDQTAREAYERLAGRVEALGLLYRALDPQQDGVVDLGSYLTEVASAVIAANGTECVRLDIHVDKWPTSIDVAIDLGLVVNELVTNSLKHAFRMYEPGIISLTATCDPELCRVVVADNGRGLAQPGAWPKPGKLSFLIVRSLKAKAKATFKVESAPGEGMRVTLEFPTPAHAR